MAPKKILMIVGDFVEDYEAMVPFQILTMVGHTVHAVCPGKKSGETVATAVHDFEGQQTYSEKRGHNVHVNHDFAAVHAKDYDALVLPGGRAPEYLRLDDKVLDLIREFFKANKPCAAICHAPQMLVAAGVLSGRSCSAYPAVKPDVIMAGGKYIEATKDMTNAHVDGNLVSGPAWPAHPSWMREFLRLLGSTIAA